MASEDMSNGGLSRRDALKRGAAVGAAAWVAPTVLSVSPAAAVSFQDLGSCDRFLIVKWNLPQTGDEDNQFEASLGLGPACVPDSVDTGDKTLESNWTSPGDANASYNGVVTWETDLGTIRGTWDDKGTDSPEGDCWRIDLPETMVVLTAAVKGGSPDTENYLCKRENVIASSAQNYYEYCDDETTRLAEPSYIALIVCYTAPPSA